MLSSRACRLRLGEVFYDAAAAPLVEFSAPSFFRSDQC
jgi:hypothetical protein